MLHPSYRAAELLISIPDPPDLESLCIEEPLPTFFSQNADPDEARLEAKDANKYLLAKSLFDCREFDRAASVFLSETLLNSAMPIETAEQQHQQSASKPASNANSKGKERESTADSAEAQDRPTSFNGIKLPVMSQKSLFLALYAKFMAGEKRRAEESEMVMGPHDLGTVLNQQLVVVGRLLAAWFGPRADENGDVQNSQGWLEYLWVTIIDTNNSVDPL